MDRTFSRVKHESIGSRIDAYEDRYIVYLFFYLCDYVDYEFVEQLFMLDRFQQRKKLFELCRDSHTTQSAMLQIHTTS